MTRFNKKSGGIKSIKDMSGFQNEERGSKRRWTWVIVVLAIIAVILVVISPFYYKEYIAPFRRVVITVDDTSISMDYFLKRLRIAGIDAFTMLESLAYEKIMVMEAPHLGIEISPAEIDEELRNMARGESETITEAEFKEWYRQQLNETELSNKEFREVIQISLLSSELYEILADKVSTVAEQVHVYAILAGSYDDALVIRERWEMGEEFEDLVQEASLDEDSRKRGGELGWFPRGVMGEVFDAVAFTLDVNDVSEPVPLEPIYDFTSPYVEQFFYLLRISEKSDSRELDENALQVLKEKALSDWLKEQKEVHTIKFNYNSEIHSWVNWQLSKSR